MDLFPNHGISKSHDESLVFGLPTETAGEFAGLVSATLLDPYQPAPQWGSASQHGHISTLPSNMRLQSENWYGQAFTFLYSFHKFAYDETGTNAPERRHPKNSRDRYLEVGDPQLFLDVSLFFFNPEDRGTRKTATFFSTDRDIYGVVLNSEELIDLVTEKINNSGQRKTLRKSGLDYIGGVSQNRVQGLESKEIEAFEFLDDRRFKLTLSLEGTDTVDYFRVFRHSRGDQTWGNKNQDLWDPSHPGVSVVPEGSAVASEPVTAFEWDLTGNVVKYLDLWYSRHGFANGFNDPRVEAQYLRTENVTRVLFSGDSLPEKSIHHFGMQWSGPPPTTESQSWILGEGTRIPATEFALKPDHRVAQRGDLQIVMKSEFDDQMTIHDVGYWLVDEPIPLHKLNREFLLPGTSYEGSPYIPLYDLSGLYFPFEERSQRIDASPGQILVAYAGTRRFDFEEPTGQWVQFETVVPEPFVRQPGDANEDRQFDTLDIEQVLAAAKYETAEPATWAQGDWTGDGFFGTDDIVAALATNLFETGPYAANVPEPSGMFLILAGIAVAMRRVR